MQLYGEQQDYALAFLFSSNAWMEIGRSTQNQLEISHQINILKHKKKQKL